MNDRIRVRDTTTLSEHYGVLRETIFDYHRLDGSWQTLKRETYERGDAAAVLPHDPVRGTVLLVRQFRFAAARPDHDGTLIEAIAGLLDGGEPEATVRREAEEEAGVTLRDVTRIFSLFMSPGVFTERLTFFTATYGADDRRQRGGGLAEEGEDIEILEMTLDAALDMVRTGLIHDAKTVILLQHLALRRP